MKRNKYLNKYFLEKKIKNRKLFLASLSNPRPDVWRIVGKMYGYPDCCIDAFIKLEHLDCQNLSADFFYGSGFIPCKKHRGVHMRTIKAYINTHRDKRFEKFEELDKLNKFRMKKNYPFNPHR